MTRWDKRVWWGVRFVDLAKTDCSACSACSIEGDLARHELVELLRNQELLGPNSYTDLWLLVSEVAFRLSDRDFVLPLRSCMSPRLLHFTHRSRAVRKTATLWFGM